MNSEEKKIIDLYLDKKLSAQQIASKLSIRLSHVLWVLKKYSVPKRSISDAISNIYITKFDKKPFKLKKKLSKKDELLKIAAVMLYWGEGTKSGGGVVLSNSNTKMIKLFLKFLREICGVDEGRLGVTLHLYEDHIAEVLIQEWSRIIGLPVTQFHKPFLHKKTKGSYREKSKHGTASLYYYDKKLLTLINSWTQYYSKLLDP